jgi:DivIVA domain-containing protein
MATVLLILVVVLVLAALVFGVVSLLSGDDPGLGAVEPDGRAVPLPNNRSLTETDLKTVRFDLGWRGYRMAQVDRVLRRTAYDVGYKDEMIAVLEAEVLALREGRAEDAELLRKARESAANPSPVATVDPGITIGPLAAEDPAVTTDPELIRDPADSGNEPAESWRATIPEVAASDSEEVASSSSDESSADHDAVSAAEAARLEEARQEAGTPGTLADRATRKHGHGGRFGKGGRSPRPSGRTGGATNADAPRSDGDATGGDSPEGGDAGSGTAAANGTASDSASGASTSAVDSSGTAPPDEASVADVTPGIAVPASSANGGTPGHSATPGLPTTAEYVETPGDGEVADPGSGQQPAAPPADRPARA